MRRVAEYQENAKACRDLARKMPLQQREQLLMIAEEWERLAAERELGVKEQAPKRR
jgi:hypothetical protein